jgi:diguanylate cyclase (GGDEF)-like protein
MTQTDFLTGFLSKEFINITLDKVRAECDIDKQPFSILVLDLDHFKTYNDKYGHLDGDDMLKYFASTLRISLVDIQTFIFRFGGDEFIIIFPGKTAKDVYHITREILKIVKKRPFLSRGRIYRLSFSAGIASYPSDSHDINKIIQNADKAMYFSKEHGRGLVTAYDSILRKTLEKNAAIILGIALLAGAVLYFSRSPYNERAMRWLKEKASKAHITVVLPYARSDMQDQDLVYLKSGRILKGTITRDDKDEIELTLTLDTGRGTVTVKRAEIDRIAMRQKKSGK